ncbi:MAG: 3-hydroxyacyl-CoA dehydrogenase NAD-binding domain-containing protein [Luminiphilus sp.]|nr:3-hydroxyacyl-CoA dehydrogenase NAD-binding domain-containing protein [Luminiphilus sp.]
MPLAAIIGGGVIGSAWAARFLLHGWHVNFYDPAQYSDRVLHGVLDKARRWVPEIYDALPEEGSLTLCASIADAVAGAEWVQESTPERLDIKLPVLKEIQASCLERAIVASSTSGFMPTELQTGAVRPEQILVAHPYNPVYLLPIVECVPSAIVDPATVDRAETILSDIGMKPITLGAEIPAHVGDRLLEAVWREALWLIKDGVATTEQIDDIMTHGFGLRWAQKGLFETYRTAGGEAGMKHFLEQFGPCLQWPWTKLTDVPDLDEPLINRIVEQSDLQAGGRSVSELENQRDANLVAILKALRQQDSAAGAFLNRLDAARD